MRRATLHLLLGSSFALLLTPACTVRARTALVPALRVRAVARRRRSQTGRRWDRGVYVDALFAPGAEPPPRDRAPMPVAVNDLPRRVDCRSAVLCRWEIAARHRVEEILGGQSPIVPDPRDPQ